MEEMMMMIDQTLTNEPQPMSEESITTSTCPSWKLYENPFYISSNHHHQQHQHHQKQSQINKHIHHLHLPVSTRKIAASFWDLTFFRPVMDSELDIALAQIMELKAEIEFERKLRKKVESLNKRLVRELSEERKGREALERVCEELAKEAKSNKAEIDKLKKEMEEERKMLRMAEVFREERVQMKLAEAKILLEEKMEELEEIKRTQKEKSSYKTEQKNQENCDTGARIPTESSSAASGSLSRESSARLVLGEKIACNDNNNGAVSSMVFNRKASPEPENPHIKRGIKGFVEFPRVVRAIGLKSRHLGMKLECQKAQLRILLNQKSPIRSNNFIMS